MFEVLIGLLIISLLMYAVLQYFQRGQHLSDIDRAKRLVEQIEGFNCSFIFLRCITDKPAEYAGFALDDKAKRLLCFFKKPGVTCEYKDILEWRILVNKRSVACLSRLSSADLQVQEPDRSLAVNDFLRHYCDDQSQDPVLESVTIKFLIRNFNYPTHVINVYCLEQKIGLEACLAEALNLIDKFKIIMYADRNP